MLETITLIAKSISPLCDAAITADPSGLLLAMGIRMVAIKEMEICKVWEAPAILWNTK